MTGSHPAFKYAKHKHIKFRMEMKDNSYSVAQLSSEIEFQASGGKTS